MVIYWAETNTVEENAVVLLNTSRDVGLQMWHTPDVWEQW
jgi:hypothetical protein